MTESGKSLSNSKNYCSVFEKISKINDVKQNEKHPFINNMFSCKQLKHMSEKNIALGGTQTLTSHSLGKHPNHLNHQLYMLLTVLNSSLSAYWSGPGP